MCGSHSCLEALLALGVDARGYCLEIFDYLEQKEDLGEGEHAGRFCNLLLA